MVFINEISPNIRDGCEAGGGGGGGRNGGNCGTGVRANISKPTPFIYLAFEKQTHSYTLSPEMLIYSYTAL